MKLRSSANFDTYSKYIKAVAGLSGLFSDSATPLINYRTAERLFTKVSGYKDESRKDCSFDAVSPDSKIGVGVKTFTCTSVSDTSNEKVAEFSKAAYLKELMGLKGKALATKVGEFRNQRILSDVRELELEMSHSYYHCLVRIPGGVVVHEEPYELLDLTNLKPLTRTGKETTSWASGDGETIYFTDGKSRYSFHSGKNTLFKKFDLTTYSTSAVIGTSIVADIFDGILNFFQIGSVVGSEAGALRISMPEDAEFVILPLYSTRNHAPGDKSGINQWNAGGRKRSFGEAYIPVPADVKNLKPDFFPARDKKFKLLLPNGKNIKAKICQENGKALMADPNTDLCDWLFRMIDGDMSIATERLTNSNPYKYEDLLKIGKDAVEIRKTPSGPADYELRLAGVGSYEEFINSEPSE
jgi:hypothetical protein